MFVYSVQTGGSEEEAPLSTLFSDGLFSCGVKTIHLCASNTFSKTVNILDSQLYIYRKHILSKITLQSSTDFVKSSQLF